RGRRQRLPRRLVARGRAALPPGRRAAGAPSYRPRRRHPRRSALPHALVWFVLPLGAARAARAIGLGGGCRPPGCRVPRTRASPGRRTCVNVRLDGRGLTLEEVVRVARTREAVEIGPEVGARMRASRAVVEEALASGTPVYGVNTGFGELKNRHIEA